MFVKKDTLEKLTDIQLRLAHKNVSFPKDGPQDEWLDENGYARLVEVAAPEKKIDDKVAIQDGVEIVDGIYREKWSYRDMTQDELDFQKQSVISKIDQVRWEFESSGVKIGQMIIPTRERDMVLINGKINYALLKQLPDTNEFTFVLNSNETSVSVGQLKAIGIAMAEHVQKTIDVAAEIRPLVVNGTLKNEQQLRDKFAELMNQA